MRSNEPLLDKVLLEELGHWFDDSAGIQDSLGDEGDLFSRRILGYESNNEFNSNIHSSGYLSVNGEIYAVEFDANAPVVNFGSSDTAVTADGLSIQLQFSEGLTALADDSAGSVRSQFTIEADGVSINPTSISLGDGAGTDDLITLSIPSASKIAQGSVVTISYVADGVNAIKDLFGTPVLLSDFTATEIANSSTQDLVAPTFLANDGATTVAAAGTSIDLKFSENLAAVANNQAEFDQFTVKVNGVANAVTATALTNDVLTLTLTNKIGSGDVVTVEYAQDSGSGSEITDADATNANPLSDFTATLITNGSTQDLVVPTFLANDAATTVAAAGTSIDLKFSEELSSSS